MASDGSHSSQNKRILSSRSNLWKPTPEAAIFIDDMPLNIASAAELGIKALHLPKNKKLTELLATLA